MSAVVNCSFAASCIWKLKQCSTESVYLGTFADCSNIFISMGELGKYMYVNVALDPALGTQELARHH